MKVILVLLSLLPVGQDLEEGGDVHDRARKWIEGLRSDKIEERESAMRRLKDLGNEARPELEKATRDPDPEVADRAAQLVLRLRIPVLLSARLRKSLSGIEDRLAFGGLHAWTETLLRLAQTDLKGKKYVPRYSELGREDLEPLIGRAFRGAVSGSEKSALCFAAETWPLRSAAPNVIALLGDADLEVRRAALIALGHLGAREAAPEIARYIADRNSHIRRIAVWAIAVIDAGEQASALVELLQDPESGIRGDAVWALGVLDAKQAAPDIHKLLEDGDEYVRSISRKVLEALRSGDSKGAIRKRMGLGE